MKCLELVVLICLFVLVKGRVSYENYKVYKVVPRSSEQVKNLADLKKDGYYFWSDDVYGVGSDVRIMVSPAQDEHFKLYSKNTGLNTTVAISNVQDLIDAQMVPAFSSRSSRMLSFSWDQYHNLEEINTWLDELAKTYPDHVSTVSMGKSYEGRDIKGVIIDLKKGQRGEKPLIGMIEGGIHAREWISPATVTWIIKEFLTSNDPDVKVMAETFIWHIFPSVNPDGYTHTFENNRMWRKTRNPTNFVSCQPDNDLGNGIDLNRNFNYVWNSIGASQNPCDETYSGPRAASEVETVAIQNYVMNLKSVGNVMYYLAFHSWSQMILIPYSHLAGHDAGQPANYPDLYEIAMAGSEKLTATHGTAYKVGTSVDILYAVSGSSFDWARGVADIPIVYLFELRDTGRFGFLLPTAEIVPNNEEIMACLIAMEKRARSLNYYKAFSGAGSVVSSVFALAIAVLFLVMLQ